MSFYRYIPKGYYSNIIPHSVIIFDRLVLPKDTLHDQQEAFDRLRKETAIDCFDCSGMGKWYVGTKNEQDCHICLGECETCAYCDFAYHLCTCGETN